MKDAESVHQKFQEHIACFADTDPLQEMSRMRTGDDSDTAAQKWLALAALHGITAGAEKISVRRTEDGGVRVTAKYREAQLPAPSPELAGRIIDTLRQITHIDEKKGSSRLALGVKDSSVAVGVKVKSEGHKEKATISFPPAA